METIDITDAEMAQRIVRFGGIEPSNRSSKARNVPAVVTELLIPRALYPIMGPEGADSPVFNFAMHGPSGISMTIADVAPGDGPAPHHETDEVFFVLDGTFRIEWGDESITDVEYTPEVGEAVATYGGTEVRALLEAAGIGFAAGIKGGTR